MVVPKKGNKLRMCVDYKYLKKAYPKNSFPLLNIDHMVDTKADHEILSLLDTYFGYNQICMDSGDQERLPSSLNIAHIVIR